MISRRAFLSALAALPFVGKMIPQQEPKRLGIAVRFVKQYDIAADQNPMHLVYQPDAFKFVMRPARGVTGPRLTFAEWDRKFNG